MCGLDTKERKQRVREVRRGDNEGIGKEMRTGNERRG